LPGSSLEDDICFFTIPVMNCRYCSKCPNHLSTQWHWLWSFCNWNPQWCGSASSYVCLQCYGPAVSGSVFYTPHTAHIKEITTAIKSTHILLTVKFETTSS